MLGTDVGVIHLEGLAQTQLEDLLGARGEGDVASRCRGAVTYDLLHLGADCLQGNVKGLEGLGGNALALTDEPEQQVLGTDVIVVQGLGLILGQDDDPARSVNRSNMNSPRMWSRSTTEKHRCTDPLAVA